MSSPEAPDWVRDGNVVYEGVASIDLVPDEIRKELEEEAAILDGHLKHNHQALVSSGVAQKVLDIERAMIVLDADPGNWEEEDVGKVEACGIDTSSIDPLEILQEQSELLRVDEQTQFRLAENIELPEPTDPSLPGGILYLAVFNGQHDLDLSVRTHKIGSLIYGESGSTALTEIPEIPEGLRLLPTEIKEAGALLERIKTDGSLVHLDRNGRYDTLTVGVYDEISKAA